jgi:hypothetical protein
MGCNAHGKIKHTQKEGGIGRREGGKGVRERERERGEEKRKIDLDRVPDQGMQQHSAEIQTVCTRKPSRHSKKHSESRRG